MMRHAISIAFVMSVMACSFRPALREAQFVESDGEYSLAAYLRDSNIALRTLANGSVALENTPIAREALHHYLDMTMVRKDVILNNIANIPTIPDVDVTRSGPRPPPYSTGLGYYQRQRVKVTESGKYSIVTVPRTGDARFRRYDPMNPSGGEDGYVEYPEIDPEIEMTDLADARQKYDLVVTLIRSFTPTVHIPDWGSFDDEAPSPPNAYSAPAGSALNMPPPELAL